MVAYSFQRQFEAPILAGIKRQTIRAHRKRHAMPAERMHLYVGMRTKHCRMIGTGTCSAVLPITIDLAENSVLIAGVTHTGWQSLDKIAMADGFDGWLSMRAFWAVNHPGRQLWSGLLLRWDAFMPFRRLNP
jgi:hypothetical protein